MGCFFCIVLEAEHGKAGKVALPIHRIIPTAGVWDWKDTFVRENSQLFPLAILLHLDL